MTASPCTVNAMSFFEQAALHARSRPNSTAIIYEKRDLSYKLLLDLVEDLDEALRHFFGPTLPSLLLVDSPKVPIWAAAFIWCSSSGVIFSPDHASRLLREVGMPYPGALSQSASLRIIEQADHGPTLHCNHVAFNGTISYGVAQGTLYLLTHIDNHSASIQINASEKKRETHEQLALETNDFSPFYLNWTTGTTACPRAYFASSSNIFHNTQSVTRSAPLNNEDAFLCTFRSSVHPHDTIARPLLCGAAAILSGTTPIEVAHALSVVERPIYLMTTPTHLRHFKRVVERDTAVFRPLDSVEVTGNAFNATLVEWLENTLSSEVYCSWGSTQTSGVAIIGRRTRGDRQNSRLGRICPGYQGELRNPNNPGTNAVMHSSGEFVVSGLALADAYLDAPDYKEVQRTHSVFASGDMMQQSKDGDFHFVGRKDNSIKVSGYKIFPEAIELALLPYADDRFVCAFGVPDEKTDEALIVAVDGPLSNEIESALLKILEAELGVVGTFARVIFVPEIPTNAFGKPDRALLKAALA